jgi:uncharacterized repeat protein (TIGR01451 family)
MTKYSRLFFVLVFLASSFLVMSAPARTQAATTINVSTATELIQAINDANSEVAPYVGADTIILDADITLIAAEASSSNIGGGQAGLPDIITDITIQAGAGSTIERAFTTCDPNDNDPDFRIFNVMAGRIGGVLALDGITVQYGCVAPGAGGSARGGGIYNDSGATLSLSNTIVAYNTALGSSDSSAGSGEGGGIFNGGTITSIVNSSIVYNTAQGGAGGSYGGWGSGGGISAWNIITSIANSTIAYNTAQGGTGSEYAGWGEGGGISIIEATIESILNSTIAHNTAQGGDGGAYGGGGAGGGISNGGLLLSLANSTVAANHALGGTGSATNGDARGGGLYSYDTTVFSSILADSDITPGGGSATPNDCALSPEVGSVTSDDYNVVEAPGNCTFAETSDQTGTDPALGALTDNGCTETLPGGACVETMAINALSSAFDQGSCGLTSITEDERGADYARPQDDLVVANADDGCDSGAFEAPVEIEVDLAVTKMESIDPVEAGSGAGNLIYVVTVTNTSVTYTATGVELSEVLMLPAGVTVDSITPSAGTFVDPTWTVGTLAPGASETLIIVMTVDDTAAAGTDVISDTATITALDQTDPNPANDSATEATSIIVVEKPKPTKEPPVVPVVSDPSLSKIGVLQPGGLGVPGEQITWTITLRAPSNTALTNVTVTDTFPPELRVDGVTTTTGTATINGQTVTVTIPYLNAGASVEIRVTTTILSYPDAPYIENTAVATADGGVNLTATARVPVVQSLPNTGYPPGN